MTSGAGAITRPCQSRVAAHAADIHELVATGGLWPSWPSDPPAGVAVLNPRDARHRCRTTRRGLFSRHLHDFQNLPPLSRRCDATVRTTELLLAPLITTAGPPARSTARLTLSLVIFVFKRAESTLAASRYERHAW